LLKLHKNPQINCCHDLAAANLKNGYFIIDDDEISHSNILEFISKADLSCVLVFINEHRIKEIIKLANLGVKYLISYEEVEKKFSEALDALTKGSSYFSESIKDILLSSFGANYSTLDQITKREEAVISLFGKGMSAIEIGSELHISNLTVNVHRSNIKRKLNISSNSKFIKYCIDKKSTH
jgi:two-component system nitrate/nitrite response regulator NarL